MKVNSLVFTETGSYNQQVLRPYETQCSEQALRSLREVTDGNNFAASTLAGLAGNIIRPVAQAVGNANIENGWDTRRLRFFLEISHDQGPSLGGFQTNNQIIQILTGYTDYVGATVNQNIDPNMRLFFNNSMMFRSMTVPGPMGNRTNTNMFESSHVLREVPGDSISGLNKFGGFGHYTQRPQDIFHNMESQLLGAEGTVFDLRTGIGNSLTKSRRSNGSAPLYLSNTMKAYSYAQGAAGTADDVENIAQSARGCVKESTVATDHFLGNVGRYSEFNENGSITYGELCAMDASTDFNTKVILSGPVERLHTPGDTAYWNTAETETIVATILSHAIPAIMMDCMLSYVAFEATNNTIGCQIAVYPEENGMRCFNSKIDNNRNNQIFIQRMIAEVLSDISHNNQMSFNISVRMDIYGESHIHVSLNGGQTNVYVMPSFCDGLISPVLSNSSDQLTHIANDVEIIMNDISDYSYHSYNPDGFSGITGEPVSPDNLDHNF